MTDSPSQQPEPTPTQPADAPAPRDDGQPPAPTRSSWPVKPYLGWMTLWFLLTMGYTAQLDGENTRRVLAAVLIYGVFTARLYLAVRTLEQGRRWITYMIYMPAVLAFWVYLEHSRSSAVGP